MQLAPIPVVRAGHQLVFAAPVKTRHQLIVIGQGAGMLPCLACVSSIIHVDLIAVWAQSQVLAICTDGQRFDTSTGLQRRNCHGPQSIPLAC